MSPVLVIDMEYLSSLRLSSTDTTLPFLVFQDDVVLFEGEPIDLQDPGGPTGALRTPRRGVLLLSTD